MILKNRNKFLPRFDRFVNYVIGYKYNGEIMEGQNNPTQQQDAKIDKCGVKFKKSPRFRKSQISHKISHDLCRTDENVNFTNFTSEQFQIYCSLNHEKVNIYKTIFSYFKYFRCFKVHSDINYALFYSVGYISNFFLES